jgi:hypothetical protein
MSGTEEIMSGTEEIMSCSKGIMSGSEEKYRDLTSRTLFRKLLFKSISGISQTFSVTKLSIKTKFL